MGLQRKLLVSPTHIYHLSTPNGAANPDTEEQSFITAFSVTSTGDIFQNAISRHAKLCN